MELFKAKEEKRLELEKRRGALLESRIADVSVCGGLWKDEEQMDRELGKLSSEERNRAVISQLKLRKVLSMI